MYKFDTRKITQTRDVRWIKQMFTDTDWKEKDEPSDLDDDDFKYEHPVKKEEMGKENNTTKEEDEQKIST